MLAALELVGDRVRMRTTVVSDRTRLIEIRSTPEVSRWWRVGDLVAEFDRNLADDETCRLTITVDDAIIGLIQFSEEDDPEYRHASIDVYLDPTAHRRGHATDAIATVMRHLFDELGHHRITIDPATANKAAIACYSGLGFRTVGTMRSYEQRSDGTWADGLLMELLAADFTARRRA